MRIELLCLSINSPYCVIELPCVRICLPNIRFEFSAFCLQLAFSLTNYGVGNIGLSPLSFLPFAAAFCAATNLE